jgi:co-chaperonin GroES (HSP10)
MSNFPQVTTEAWTAVKYLPRGLEVPPVIPQNEWVLVYLEPEDEKFSGYSIIRVSDKNSHPFRIGRVLKVGQGQWNKKKTLRKPIGVEVGSRVLFVKYVATHTKTAESIQGRLGKDFALVKNYDLLLQLDDDLDPSSLSQ